MSSFRARAAVVAVVVSGFVVTFPVPARAATQLLVIGVDQADWQRLAVRHPGSFGLGVFPDSRDPSRFIEEIGSGAPTSRPGARSVVRGSPGSLGRWLTAAGLTVRFPFGGPTGIKASLARAFAGASVAAPRGDASILVRAASFSDAEALLGRTKIPAIVLGVGARTPVWITVCFAGGCGDESASIATGAITRRPAIVTPYDIATSILEIVGVAKPAAFIGKTLQPQASTAPLDRVRRLATHIERGAGLGSTRGATTTLLAIGALFVGLLLRRRGKWRLSARTGQAAGIAVVGYLVALFVPSGDGTLLALVITAVVVAGASLRFRDPARSMGRLMLGAAAAFSILVLVAPLRPGGLPGAAIWGNPLTSWRFTGVQNFEVSFIAVCVVVWAVLAGLKPLPLTVVALAATVIVGAPRVGSNFVGVLTLAFGAALAVLALVRKRVELWQAVASVVVASAAFVLSLVADAASPVSHGGRAARRISEGGFSTLVDFVEARIRLNLDLMGSFKAGTGYILMAMMLVVVALLMRWGATAGEPQRGRSAVWAGTAMALSSLLLEDSGFYSGAIMLVAAGAAWMIVTATDEPREVSSSDPALAGGG